MKTFTILSSVKKNLRSLSAISIIALSSCTMQPALAQGIEKTCYDQSELLARAHQNMKYDPDYIKAVLETLAENKNGNSPKIQERLKEAYFFAINRLHLSNEDFKRLAFMKCYTGWHD